MIYFQSLLTGEKKCWAFWLWTLTITWTHKSTLQSVLRRSNELLSHWQTCYCRDGANASVACSTVPYYNIGWDLMQFYFSRFPDRHLCKYTVKSVTFQHTTTRTRETVTLLCKIMTILVHHHKRLPKQRMFSCHVAADDGWTWLSKADLYFGRPLCWRSMEGR